MCHPGSSQLSSPSYPISLNSSLRLMTATVQFDTSPYVKDYDNSHTEGLYHPLCEGPYTGHSVGLYHPLSEGPRESLYSSLFSPTGPF